MSKASMEGSNEYAEDPRNLTHTATYFNGEDHVGMSAEHQQFLLQRHGTLDLDPVPGPGSADPYNWPNWKV